MSTGGRPVELITAVGPFTLNDDLSFQPLEDLLDMCCTQKPDVILLAGPFVHEDHPKIKSGTSQFEPEEIFQEQVIRRLERVLKESQHTQVLILPHPTDVE
jgi:DNA polymerase alpha subunit B